MKLYGLAISNYYNVVKLALLEKQLAFEEVKVAPSQEPEVIAHSPMGKIPYLQHEDLYFSESQAILFYLEAYKPTPQLYPKDPALAARAQQIHQFIDLYIDAPPRTLLGAAFFGGTASEEAIEKAEKQLERNLRALNSIISFSPFVAGTVLTHADFAAFMTFLFAQAVMGRLGRHDPLSHLPGIGAYIQMMSERDSCRRVLEDQKEALASLQGN
ncbi:glutathione S-transferase family protein [Motiliproteus sp. SC1-56]|uniref:glutathione S-transferase family protein n=1 Tax=Motiliproteus sp. SC1-56 TaxID=2799565 RepID=UPI001A8E1E58|nr:glutathione S-transferase family protein [Motiliproteus sp. SC1-56]